MTHRGGRSSCRRYSPYRVVMEATGGLELPLVAALSEAELPVVIINPRQVRDFPDREIGHRPAGCPEPGRIF